MYVMLSIAITTLFRGLSNRENIQVVAFTAPNAQTNGATPSSFAPRFLSPAVIINSARIQERSIRLRKSYNLKQTIIPWPAQRSVILFCGLL